MVTGGTFAGRCTSDLETLRRARAAYRDATQAVIAMNQLPAFEGPDHIRQQQHGDLVRALDEAVDRLLMSLGDLEMRGFMDRLEGELVLERSGVAS